MNSFARGLVFAVLSVAWILALMAVIVAMAPPSATDADGGRPPVLADLRPATDDEPASEDEGGLRLGERGVAVNHLEEEEEEEEEEAEEEERDDRRRERKEERQRQREAREDDRGDD